MARKKKTVSPHPQISLPELDGFDLTKPEQLRQAATHLRSCADSMDEAAQSITTGASRLVAGRWEIRR